MAVCKQWNGIWNGEWNDNTMKLVQAGWFPAYLKYLWLYTIFHILNNYDNANPFHNISIIITISGLMICADVQQIT